jgi:putative ABC transport system permease protein
MVRPARRSPCTSPRPVARTYPPPTDGETTPATERCQSWQLGGQALPGDWSGSPGLVADLPALRALGYRLDAAQERVLRSGGVLVPHAALVDATGHARLTTYRLSADGITRSGERTTVVRAAPAPALLADPHAAVQDVIATPATAHRLQLGWYRSGGVLSPGPVLTEDQEARLREAVLGTADSSDVYTERGFVSRLGLPLLGLGALALVAVLLGTLSTTGLTLAETRPDLATLAAVGARPRTRRIMAAAQALVVGLLGAVAGTVVGAVPGLAVTWPLTADTSGTVEWGSPTIDVPWLLLLAVALAVPLVAAATAGLAVRSRLPLTRRLGQ